MSTDSRRDARAAAETLRKVTRRFVQAARNDSATPKSWTVHEDPSAGLRKCGLRFYLHPGAPHYPRTIPRATSLRIQDEDGTLIHVHALGDGKPSVSGRTRSTGLWHQTRLRIPDLATAMQHICDPANGLRPPAVKLETLSVAAQFCGYFDRSRDPTILIDTEHYRTGILDYCETGTAMGRAGVLDLLAQAVDVGYHGPANGSSVDVQDPQEHGWTLWTPNEGDDTRDGLLRSAPENAPQDVEGAKNALSAAKAELKQLRWLINEIVRRQAKRPSTWDKSAPVASVARIYQADQ